MPIIRLLAWASFGAGAKGGSTGLGGGNSPRTSPCPPHGSGRADCNRAGAESALGNYSLTKASPAPFSAAAGPRARKSIVRAGLLAPRRPPCREVLGSP